MSEFEARYNGANRIEVHDPLTGSMWGFIIDRDERGRRSLTGSAHAGWGSVPNADETQAAFEFARLKGIADGRIDP